MILSLNEFIRKKVKEDFTFFGTKKVAGNIKTDLVDKLFSNVSSRYDIMNDLMSGGIHRIWKDQFSMLMDKPKARLLDVAGGTCDITERYYSFAEKNGYKPEIVVCDLNHEMLKLGSDKMMNKGLIGINFINGNAESLPFADNSFDYYSVSFGIRNFTYIDKALKEAKRVLKKNGKFLCLEFSKPRNMLLNKVYDIYSRSVIPALGSTLVDKESYEYLVESIKKFPSQEEFMKMIKDAGFHDVAFRDLSGGIVAIHTGYKV